MSNFQLHYSPNCPIDIFNHPKLNNNEKMIYIVIHSIIGSKEKKCILTNEDIASASNTGVRTVNRAIQKLFELELIWIDTDRKRAAKDKNEAVRSIYTNYKYYVDRNKSKTPTLRIPKFNSINHFINWCKPRAMGFETKMVVKSEDGEYIYSIKINERGYLENTNLKREYNPSTEFDKIKFIWNKLYENHETVTKYVLDKENQNKEKKENE